MRDPTTEKDTWDFPIVGTQYTPKGTRWAVNLLVGDILTLVPEPKNHYDPYAIMVMCGDELVGYVPNKGWSCSSCWYPVQKFDNFCTHCNGAHTAFVQGGLSRRIANLKILDDTYACFISKVEPHDKFAPVRATLIIK